MRCGHGRRIYAEEQAKLVAAVWGTEFIKFLVALAIFYQDDVKDIMKSSFSSLLLECNSSFSSYLPGAARNRINSVPQTAATNFAFSFVWSWTTHGIPSLAAQR